MIRGLALLCACVALLVTLSAWTAGPVPGESRGDGALAASSLAAGSSLSGDIHKGDRPDHERRPCRDRLAGSLAPCAVFATLSSAGQVAPPSPERLIFALQSDRMPRQLLGDARFRPPRPSESASRA